MFCSIQNCPKCVIALWFSVWEKEIDQVPAKTQQQRWWELWVQERKKHKEIQTYAEESWRSWSHGKTNIFPLSNSDEIKSRWLDSHPGGWHDISSLCDSVLELPDATVGQLLLSPFGQGATGYEIKKFPFESHRVSFAEVWVLPPPPRRRWQDLNSTHTVDLGHVTNPQSRVFSWGWTYMWKSCHVQRC